MALAQPKPLPHTLPVGWASTAPPSARGSAPRDPAHKSLSLADLPYSAPNRIAHLAPAWELTPMAQAQVLPQPGRGSHRLCFPAERPEAEEALAELPKGQE